MDKIDIISTTKQGEVGPTGPMGPQGIPGPQGPAGPQGPRGERGDRGPQGERGNDGYNGRPGPQGPPGPMGSVRWEDGVLDAHPELRGPQGIQGERGPQGPTGSAGVQGPRGPQGPVGPQGEKGVRGERGERGEVGPRGERGPMGPKGAKGDTGAMGPQGPRGNDGFNGERGLRGPRGPMGPQGPQGDRGPQGLKGEAGKDGNVDFNTLTEEQLQMLRGPKGEKGDGIRILGSLPTTPHHRALTARRPDWKLGDSWHIEDTHEFKVWNGTEWVTFAQVRGPKGDKGDRGLQGEKGDRGEQGVKGEQGETGAIGPAGPIGIQGQKGDKGDTGAMGPVGPQGATGPQGAKGEKGDPGSSVRVRDSFETWADFKKYIESDKYTFKPGDCVFIRTTSGVGNYPNHPQPNDFGKEGIYLYTREEEAPTDDERDWKYLGEYRGIKGDRGEIGPMGPVGPRGEKGDGGDRGATGAQGATGPQGPAGATGPTGPRGATGPEGPQGATGATGPQGPQGESGNIIKDIASNFNETRPGTWTTNGSFSDDGKPPSDTKDGVLEVFPQWQDRILQRWTACGDNTDNKIYTRVKKDTGDKGWTDWKLQGGEVTEQQVDNKIQSKKSEIENWANGKFAPLNRFWLHPQTDNGKYSTKGLFKIPMGNGKAGDFVVFWEEIYEDFGWGGSGMVTITLENIMTEIYSIQITPRKNDAGEEWNFPIYQVEQAPPNHRRLNIRCSKGGRNKFQLLVLGRKWGN